LTFWDGDEFVEWKGFGGKLRHQEFMQVMLRRSAGKTEVAETSVRKCLRMPYELKRILIFKFVILLNRMQGFFSQAFHVFRDKK